MNWRQNTDIMHLSCNFARRTFCGTYSTYILLKADSACKNVRNLVHDVVPWKRYVLQGTWSFRMFRHFWNGLSVVRFSVGLAVVRHPADTFHVELVRACARILYAREILRSCARSYLAIACTIVRTIFLVGPGFEPLALHAIFFVGPGFDSLTLQHDLFVGPGFDSRTRSPVFRPVVSVAYVTRPHD